MNMKATKSMWDRALDALESVDKPEPTARPGRKSQRQVMLEVWATIPAGQFNIYDYEHRVNDLLHIQGSGISGSGLTAQMRALRKETRHAVFNIYPGIGPHVEIPFDYSYNRSTNEYIKII